MGLRPDLGGSTDPLVRLFHSRYSYDLDTAFSQGQSGAINAYDQLFNLGFANGAAGTSVVYDLEGFDTSNSSCVSAVAAFIEGWTDQPHVAASPACWRPWQHMWLVAGNIRREQPSPRLHRWSLLGRRPIHQRHAMHPSSCWIYNQRLKRCVGGHDERYGGATPYIDNDRANGPTASSEQIPGSSCSEKLCR